MSGMARADLIYSENVYLIIQIQPSDGSNMHSKQNEKKANSDMAFAVMIVFPGI